MKYLQKLLVYFLVNLLILSVANSFFGEYIVFGRLEIGMMQAIATAAFGISLAVLIVDLFMTDFNIKVSDQAYLGIELATNIGALYLLARTALQNSVGVGIVGFWVAPIVGLSLSLGQFAAKKMLDRRSGR